MQQTETIIFIIIANILLLVFVVGIILFILQYKKKKVEHEKEKSMIAENHTQELLTTQLEMQTQTMQHIGREIHDNVGQKLTLASLYTQQLAYENKAPHINDKIENISNIINDSLAELRQLSKTLTDDTINNSSIIELLQNECEKINHLKKCNVHFRTSQQKIVCTYLVKSILLRIVQEFFQNSIKHAACKNIQVSITSNKDFIELILKDDGKGFDTNNTSGNGIGLANMKKRAELIGGIFLMESNEKGGTTLSIKIPEQK